MRLFKIGSTIVVALLLGVMLSTAVFAQDAKVVEMKGTNQLKFSVTKIVVSPGQKVTVKLTTVSNMPAIAMSHNFVLLKASADVSKVAIASSKARSNGYIPPDMDNKIIAYTDLAAGGETVTVTFTAPEEPGKYPYICTFPGHYQSGMKGILVVK